jgi:hypothetical protein
VHNGAEDKGELPVTAWQALQLASNPACTTAVWAVLRKGTEWFAPPDQENAS